MILYVYNNYNVHYDLYITSCQEHFENTLRTFIIFVTSLFCGHA